jgi:catechol 2,3-dioxygenase-like lactoylglutathione lyase family enzyme
MGSLGRWKIDRVVPVLAVADVARSLDYYCHKLGFTEDFIWGDPPAYASIVCGGGEINLARRVGQSAERSQIYVYVTDVRSYFAHCSRRGAELIRGLEKREHGMLDFEIADPDGHRIAFGESSID